MTCRTDSFDPELSRVFFAAECVRQSASECLPLCAALRTRSASTILNQKGRESFLAARSTASCLSDRPALPTV